MAGMYIAELDRPWTDTPFMFQGFHLRTDRQFEALKKYCRHVFVDVARSVASGAPGAARTAAIVRAPAEEPGFAIRGSAQYSEQTPEASEIKLCSAAYARSAKAVQDLFQPLAWGGTAIDGTQIQESVRLLAESVVRNPDALLLMSKMREKGAGAHVRALQVAISMMVFARSLPLERHEIHLLGLLGLLQDVGKTRLPAELLEKQGPLTPEESRMARKHVELSAHILGSTPALPPKLADLALLHHERQDGSGYPRGLKGYQIGLYGSVAAICDTYDALMAPRPYAEQLSPSAAATILLAERGSGFHAQLVEQFIQCVGAFPVGSVVEMDSGETGIVIAQSRQQRLKPMVMVLFDAAGKELEPHHVVDLESEPQLRIRRTLEQSKIDFDARQLFV
jgi:HD-GYP domain-containing protein (c-di-GMP phosphodiesterase class II)